MRTWLGRCGIEKQGLNPSCLKKFIPHSKFLRFKVDITNGIPFTYFIWNQKVGYLITRPWQTVTGLREQVTAFPGKLKLWKRKMGENKTASFPTSKVAPGRRKCWVL